MTTTAISKAAKLVFGAAALAVSFGVAQLAAGSDLKPEAAQSPAASEVNRAAKADRAALGSITPGLTFAVRPIDQADSSYLVRIPGGLNSGEPLRPVRPRQAPFGKPMVACEPVVSVLTDIVMQLQPGRCLT